MTMSNNVAHLKIQLRYLNIPVLLGVAVRSVHVEQSTVDFATNVWVVFFTDEVYGRQPDISMVCFSFPDGGGALSAHQIASFLDATDPYERMIHHYEMYM
jgi:hypothetical protein